MYKCENCGHLFEEGEQAVWEETHGFTSPPYEKWDGCPLCKGGYEEVHQCQECEKWHTEDELYEGWCEKCLRETINYDTFFEYCEANKDEQYLDIFVMSELLGGMDCPKNVSYDFHQLMIDVYKKEVESIKFYEKQFGHKPSGDFLSACIRFIMDDDGEIGRENYADWLNKKEEKK
jgi:hypothetical protein